LRTVRLADAAARSLEAVKRRRAARAAFATASISRLPARTTALTAAWTAATACCASDVPVRTALRTAR
jgi:hypothetical protein